VCGCVCGRRRAEFARIAYGQPCFSLGGVTDLRRDGGGCDTCVHRMQLRRADRMLEREEWFRAGGGTATNGCATASGSIGAASSSWIPNLLESV
jgi:hypothetical protein